MTAPVPILAAVAILVVTLGLASQVRAQDTSGDEPTTAPGAPSASGSGLDLNDLLRPRGAFEATKTAPSEGLYGTRDETEWRAAFGAARDEVAALEKSVEELQSEMREASQGDYTFSPIGTGDATKPEVQALRFQLKRDRQSLETAHSRLRELEVEASLSGVPDSWQEPAPAP
jgi:HAMP domain-containing protein